MNHFNNANGWADGTYNLAAGGANGINPEQRHQLVVTGNAGDSVVLADAARWVNAGTVSNGGHTYTVYNATGAAAQILVDSVARSGSDGDGDRSFEHRRRDRRLRDQRAVRG
jgi:hypothetical protein